MNAIEWLSRLVAIDTTSRNSNLPLINLMKDWFEQHRLPVRLTYHADRHKANLFASLPAANGDLSGGLMLSGHTDVVPVDGQQWKTNPFSAVQKDNKIYGRGTSDMKGFLAVMLSLVPYLQHKSLQQPVHFAFSYDEEVGCCGVPLLITDLQKAGIQPLACIVGEPTNMQPVVAHKGIQLMRCRVHGHATHSSLTPQGCNAIEYAAHIIHYLHMLAAQFEDQGPFDQDFDVPFTTLSPNRIQGGTAHNIIPEFCEFYFEFRQLPRVSPAEIIQKITSYIQTQLLPVMQKKCGTTAIELDTVAAVPSFEMRETQILADIKQYLSTDTRIHKVAYATEAGLFQQAAIPTIVCGPGSIEQAHKPDEFVSIAQLEKCESVLKQMIISIRSWLHE